MFFIVVLMLVLFVVAVYYMRRYYSVKREYRGRELFYDALTKRYEKYCQAAALGGELIPEFPEPEKTREYGADEIELFLDGKPVKREYGADEIMKVLKNDGWVVSELFLDGKPVKLTEPDAGEPEPEKPAGDNTPESLPKTSQSKKRGGKSEKRGNSRK